MQVQNVTVDAEFSALIPAMSQEEFDLLEASLLAEGCREPLAVWRRGEVLLLLDGYNRDRLCRKHSIPYTTREIDLAGRPEARAWIARNQMGRRNISTGTRAMLALAIKKAEAEIAKGRNRTGKAPEPTKDDNPQQADQVANLPPSSGGGKSRDKAASKAGVSARTIQAAETVERDGTEALQKAVLDGRISVSKAAKATKLPPEEQDRLAAGEKLGPKPAAPPEDRVGRPLPDVPGVRAAFARDPEVRAFMHTISTLKGQVVKLAADKKDTIFSQLDISAFVSDLAHCFGLLKAVRPFAVCPYCKGGIRGAGKNCTACNGRGWMGEFDYRAAPEELK